MNVVGVLDLLHGQVVRGIAGQRERYRPIVSSLCSSSDPLIVASALINQFALRELYLADLDAIAGAEPAWHTYRALASLGVTLWIDAGVRNVQDGLRLSEHGTVIVGLETVHSLNVVEQLVARLGEQIVFSLDLKCGIPVAWGNDAVQIAEAVICRGVRRVLLLDLSCVGVAQGTGTEHLCVCLKSRFPDIELSVGGGVRGLIDLHRLQNYRVQTVLVASALHDGQLTPEEVALFQSPVVKR